MERLSDLPRLVVAGCFVFLAACNGRDVTAPVASATPASLDLLSAPSEGFATFVYVPEVDLDAKFGSHELKIPAGAVCALNSSYGPTEWNTACKPATVPVTITAHWYVRADGHTQVDFEPAMRFVPTKTVELWMYDKSAVQDIRQVTNTTGSTLAVLYQDKSGRIINEAKSDPDLVTKFESGCRAWRRIKHFSGYLVGAEESVSDM